MTTTRDHDPRRLGHQLAAARRGLGWSQRRLADAAGVSHGYIALLELGRLPSPGKFRLDAIARALGLASADTLLDAAEQRREQHPTAAMGAASWSTAPARDTAAWPEATGRLPSPGAASGAASPATALSSPAGAPSASVAPNVPNVVGTLDQLRPPETRLLPVFRWGSCGDPRDRESPPDPDHLEAPPLGRETLIGPNGFGVMVKGESMAGRGIHDGDVVWVNPDRSYQLGKVVLALVSDVGGEGGMVVKTYAHTDVGDCLVSETEHGRTPVVCHSFKIIGPVVGITSWRLPS